MNIRQKSNLQTLLISGFFLVLVISIAFYAQNKAQENERIHRAQEVASIIALVLEEPIKNNEINKIESLSKRLLSHKEIAFLGISFLGTERNYTSDQAISDEKISVFNQALNVNEKEIGSLTLGYKAHDESLAHYPNERSLIWGASGIGIWAILTMYIVLLRLMRPLRKLHDNPEATPHKSARSFIFQDDIYATVKMVKALKEKLKITDEELKAALINQHHSNTQARQIEEKYLAIYKASHDAIIVANDQDIIIEFSPVAEQIFGWTRDEIVGKGMAETIVPARLKSMHIEGMKRFLKTGEAFVLNKRIELTALHKQGHEFQIEICISSANTEQGVIFVSYIRDITQRILDQTELKLAAHAFETSEAMFIADNKGHIIRVNPGFTAVTGYESQDVQGCKPRSLLANADDAEFHKQVWLELNEKGMWSSELKLRHKNRIEFPVHMSMTAVKDEKNRLTHFVAHFFDMTEQKRTEQILREAQCAAELANESKSRFLAAMSHEIRTPMNGVIGVIGLLKETPLNPLQSRLVQTARDSGEILFTIINDILDFSKMEAGKLTLEDSPFDLHLLINQTINIIQPQAEHKQLNLTSDIELDTPRFLIGDGDRIRQILVNLLSNAIKYTQEGDVTLCLHSNGVKNNSCQIQIDIIDTGIGIAPENMAHLFDEFTMIENSYDRTHEGSGLGLAICQQLGHLMKGTLYAQSELGSGSTFTFSVTLKLAEEAEIAQIQADTPEREHHISKDLRILMAEDNPANQMVLRTMLEFSGLSVDIVANGLEAVEAVKQFPYHIVFMDISMPEVDGLEATKRIRALEGPKKDVIIVALTAHAIRGDKEHFLSSGMDDFVSKPVTRKAILDCLARWQPKIRNAQTGESIPLPALPLTHVPPSLETQAQLIPEKQKEECLQKSANNEPLIFEDLENEHLVDEKTLLQLAEDTSPEIMQSLLEYYLMDAEKRLISITKATKNRDFYAVEFEAHTLGSSAAAHGNLALCDLCRKIELNCKHLEHEQAINHALRLPSLARASFETLKTRITEGFMI